MSQAYLTNFLAISRQSSSVNFNVYTGNGTQIVPTNDAAALLAEVIADYSDQNREVAQRLIIIDDRSYDETYTPVQNDYTYDSAIYFGIVKEKNATLWTPYKETGTDLVLYSDKYTLLSNLRQNYGDGKFQVYQKMVITDNHSFVLVP